MTFAELAAAYHDGTLTVDRLREESVDPADFQKLRADESEDGIVFLDMPTDNARAGGTVVDDDTRRVDYVMSTQNPVGFFRDVALVAGWDLTDFKKRGMPFLFGHNSRDVPLGKMTKVGKTVVDGQRVLAGTAQFTPDGMVERNDLIYALVRDGFMPCCSVGFNVIKARQPTEADTKKFNGLTEYSSIFESMSLVEHSAVPVGMDPDAVKRSMDQMHNGGIDAWFRQSIGRGDFDPELIAELRRTWLKEEPEARTIVTVDSEAGTVVAERDEAAADDAQDAEGGLLIPDDIATTIVENSGLFDGEDDGEECDDEPGGGHRITSTVRVEVDSDGISSIEKLTAAIERLVDSNEALRERIADLEAVIENREAGASANDVDEPQKSLEDLYLEAFG